MNDDKLLLLCWNTYGESDASAWSFDVIKQTGEEVASLMHENYHYGIYQHMGGQLIDGGRSMIALSYSKTCYTLIKYGIKNFDPTVLGVYSPPDPNYD